uniref:Uncharacterized protein n=1 Tax=Anguilla anguilla TaxID=7936 RepID=A0A0E9QV98_ANGAN
MQWASLMSQATQGLLHCSET